MKYEVGDQFIIRCSVAECYILHPLSSNFKFNYCGVPIIGDIGHQFIVLLNGLSSSSIGIHYNVPPRYFGRKVIFLPSNYLTIKTNNLICYSCNKIFVNLNKIIDFKCWDCSIC